MARLIALISHFPVFWSTGTMISFILKYAAALIKLDNIKSSAFEKLKQISSSHEEGTSHNPQRDVIRRFYGPHWVANVLMQIVASLP